MEHTRRIGSHAQWYPIIWETVIAAFCIETSLCNSQSVLEELARNEAYINETFYSSSEQQRFYELFCQTNFTGYSFRILSVPFTRKIINSACKGLDNWLQSEAVRLRDAYHPWQRGDLCLLKPCRVAWGAPLSYLFSQILRVLWPRKSNVIAGHLYSHIYFVLLSVSSLLAWP